MGSTQFQVTVLARVGREIDLSFTLVGDLDVHADESFAARALHDSLSEDDIVALWPEADREQPWAWASAWMESHVDDIIEAGSVVLHDAVNHPPERPSEWQLLEPLRARFAGAWKTAPTTVVAQVRALMAEHGATLELDAEPEVYQAGELDDLLHELVSVRFDAIGALRSSAALRFRVRDPRFIAHLEPGDTFDSVAYPA
jgi:hypothetical protein